MNKIVGSFVFTDLGDGCINGKYINTGIDSPLPECCKLINEKSKIPFIGTYFSTWLESNSENNSSTLQINKKNDKYSLKWLDKNKPIFEGEAMLFNGLLIGAYWDK
jgi:hypothetical protein